MIRAFTTDELVRRVDRRVLLLEELAEAAA